MDSSLSSVPPVWPRPRPDSCGTATPQAATSGASGSVILSPTPPVECLSRRRAGQRREVHPLAGARSSRRSTGDLAAVHAAEQDRHRERRHLLVGDRAAGVGVDDPVDLAGRSAPRRRRLAAMTSTASKIRSQADHLPALTPSRRRDPRSSAPKACGSTAAHRQHPVGVIDQAVGPAVLPQQLPAAAARPSAGSPSPSTQETATSRPPPLRVQLARPCRTRRTGPPRRRRSRRCSRRRRARRRRGRPPRPGTPSTARRRAPSPRRPRPAAPSQSTLPRAGVHGLAHSRLSPAVGHPVGGRHSQALRGEGQDEQRGDVRRHAGESSGQGRGQPEPAEARRAT